MIQARTSLCQNKSKRFEQAWRLWIHILRTIQAEKYHQIITMQKVKPRMWFIIWVYFEIPDFWDLWAQFQTLFCWNSNEDKGEGLFLWTTMGNYSFIHPEPRQSHRFTFNKQTFIVMARKNLLSVSWIVCVRFSSCVLSRSEEAVVCNWVGKGDTDIWWLSTDTPPKPHWLTITMRNLFIR